MALPASLSWRTCYSVKRTAVIVAMLAACLALPVGGVTAAAKQRTTAPRQFRGTWYHYWPKSSYYDGHGLRKIVIGKHRFQESWNGQKLKATKHLVIRKAHFKKHTGYIFEKKHAIGDATVYVHTTLKIQGKRRAAFFIVPQDYSRPVAYTHANPGKHTYKGSVAFVKHLVLSK